MLKIAITGPESSGKTTLCEALATYYDVTYIDEYARIYLEQTNGEYNQSDIDQIARGQLASLNASTNHITICDSDFSVLEIWSRYKYGQVSKLITDLVNQDIFDLHILCSPDIPWEEDPLRENPGNRDELFELYNNSLIYHNKPFITVSGTHEIRMKESIKTIANLQKK